MAYAQGSSVAFLMGVESSFATLPGTPKAAKIPIISPAVKLNVNRFRSEALTGVPEPRPPVDGKQGDSGNFELECSHRSLAIPLLSLMGSVVSVGTTGWYEHYYTFGLRSSFYLEQQHSDITQYLLWKGNRIGRGSFNFNFEGLMRASMEVMGASQAISGAATTSGGNTRDDTGGDPFSYVVATVKYNGAAIAYIQDISVEISRDDEAVDAMDGTVNHQDIIGKIPTVGGNITVLFQDDDIIADSIASAEVSLEIFQPSSSLGHGLRILMPTCKLEPASPETAGQGMVRVRTRYDAYARGTASDLSGRVQSKGFTTVAIVLSTSDVLNIKVDGGASQPFTLTAGASRTPAQIVTDLAGLTGASAFVENGKVVIRSASKGTASSVQVEASSTADTVLGFVNTVEAGYAAKSVIFQLSNDYATALVP